MMKNILILFLIISAPLKAQVSFENFFTEGVMRVDYFIAGNNENGTIFLHKLGRESEWGGTKVNLIDPFNYGEFRFVIYDSVSNVPIFSRGFSCLFNEWQSTPEAKMVNRCFSQVARFPYPKKSVRFIIEERHNDGRFINHFSMYINPNRIDIETKKAVKYNVKRLLYKGASSSKVDLVFVAEGFTSQQMPVFLDAAKSMTAHLFLYSPFKEQINNFNVWAVMAPSAESGVDVPGDSIWKSTVVNASYYTFGTDRYLMTSDMFALSDAVAGVPYDNIIILCNSKIYGGGAIYNLYATSYNGGDLSNIVTVHELGHSFAGLGDEYYNSQVPYIDFYDTLSEPWEPNITSLVAFQSKWANMLEPGLSIPSPINDSTVNKIGVYEGAGYSAKGLYRSYHSCRMKDNEVDFFCPVCQRSILRMINYYVGLKQE